MPLLKDLSCSIELADNQEPLQELGTTYGDGFVETFIPVPKNHQAFTVHLSGRNFIAPGIAMYVFIDGVYQCNRNRQDLKLRRPLDRRSLVDFRVRQKEEVQKDGSMIAREWTFETLGHGSADGAPKSCLPNIVENLGCIEVVVLRCAGPRNAKSAANMNMDGAADYPDHRFDRDSRSRTTAYDDRGPTVSATRNRRLPPSPAPQYRFPYAETLRSRESSDRARSRYSEPVSPGTRPQREIPAPGFQYGSGPIPDQPWVESYRGFIDGIAPSRVSKPAPAVDPVMLEKIVADAVKRGVEESRKSEKPDGRSRHCSEQYEEDVDAASHVPGAWPTSPARASKHRSSRSGRRQHRDSDREQEQRRSQRGRATRVEWDEPGWDKQTKIDGWGSPNDESWTSDETSSKEMRNGWGQVRRRSTSLARTIREPSPRRVIHVSGRSEKSRKSPRPRRSRKSRSKPRSYWVDEMKTSSDDNDGWTPIDAARDMSTSPPPSDSTLTPSHSRSQTQKLSTNRLGPRSRSTKSPSRRLSQLTDPPPSLLVTNAPTAVSAWGAVDAASRRSGFPHADPLVGVAPPPTWGCASEKARKKSTATYRPPAAFSTVSVADASGSSTWGGDKAGRAWSEKAWSEKAWSEKAWSEKAREGEAVERNIWTTGEKSRNTTNKADLSSDNSDHVDPAKARTKTFPPRDAATERLPTQTSQEKAIHHRVLAGRGTAYGHAVSRPVYVDSLQDPYAVFRFKYGGGGVAKTEEWLAGVE